MEVIAVVVAVVIFIVVALLVEASRTKSEEPLEVTEPEKAFEEAPTETGRYRAREILKNPRKTAKRVADKANSIASAEPEDSPLPDPFSNDLDK